MTDLQRLEQSISRQLVMAMRLGRVEALRGLLDALTGNPTANVIDLIHAALEFERLVHDREQ